MRRELSGTTVTSLWPVTFGRPPPHIRNQFKGVIGGETLGTLPWGSGRSGVWTYTTAMTTTRSISATTNSSARTNENYFQSFRGAIGRSATDTSTYYRHRYRKFFNASTLC